MKTIWSTKQILLMRFLRSKKVRKHLMKENISIGLGKEASFILQVTGSHTGKPSMLKMSSFNQTPIFSSSLQNALPSPSHILFAGQDNFPPATEIITEPLIERLFSGELPLPNGSHYTQSYLQAYSPLYSPHPQPWCPIVNMTVNAQPTPVKVEKLWYSSCSRAPSGIESKMRFS